MLDYPFFKYGIVDYRTVLPNEVCIELDFKKWGNQKFWGKRVLNVLNRENIPHLMCHSGGKGLHFHIFFDINGVEQLTGFKSIRIKLYHYILNLADVPDDMRGARKPFDTTSVNFNDRGQGHLIREIGGQKRQRKRTIQTIPKENVVIPGNVVFPQKMPIWRVPSKLILDFELKNLEGLGNCNNCDIKMPARLLVADEERPEWIGCYICKHC